MINVKSFLWRKAGKGGLLGFMLISSLIWSCDTLESDEPTDEKAELTDQAVYITPANSGIINLRSLVNASSNVRLQVSSDPKFGKLQSLGNDLIQYTKNEGVTSAHDAFLVSIYSSNNNFLKSDSVIIIITPDTTNIPCTGNIMAMNDYAYYSDSTSSEGHVDVHVLANDLLCNVDTTLFEISLTVVQGIQTPYYGTAQVIGNVIRYTPGNDFNGEDKFVYQLRKPADVPNAGDPEVISHGIVYITGKTSCKNSLALFDDQFAFTLDSISSDTTGTDTIKTNPTFYLDVIANDSFCTDAVNNFSFTIVDMPQGEWSYAPNYGFDYKFPAGVPIGFTDTFTYQVCVDDVCKTARVTIQRK